MQVQPVAFSGSGEVGTAAHSATDSIGRSVSVSAQQEQVVGLAYIGFTQVIVHNGVDSTGPVVAVCGAAGTYAWNHEVNLNQGLYLECTGTGKGTVWLV